MLDDLAVSPDTLLARAAEQDALRARDQVARIPGPGLLEVVLSQALLAVEPDVHRGAGIDALAELSRATVELMGVGAAPEEHDSSQPSVTGWELLTVTDGDDLVGATTSVPARPWHLALLAFDDVPLADAVERTTVAATADGRFVRARLRIADDAAEPTVLDATVTDRLEDLGSGAALGWGLSCALLTAAAAPA